MKNLKSRTKGEDKPKERKRESERERLEILLFNN